jgi:hypothetical protein
MLSTNRDRRRDDADPHGHPVGGRAGRRRCRRDGEPYDRPDRRARDYFHLYGNRWARAAGEIFLAAGAVAAGFSVAVADIPIVVANGLPLRVVCQWSSQVIDWVSRNKDALLDFWHHGDTWTQSEVTILSKTSSGLTASFRPTGTLGNRRRVFVVQCRLQVAPPRTQNLAQCGWFSCTVSRAVASLRPRLN